MHFESAKVNMITQQLRAGNVLSEAVLEVISQLPREQFVPAAYYELAYSDFRIPLGHDEYMMTPLEEALLLQSLALDRHKTVLEVGTGSGYLTALLAKQAKHVYSVDYYADFTHDARKKLAIHDINNVTLITADGFRGYLETAPYDVMILSGAIPKVDHCYCPQLLRNGLLFAILGTAPAMEACLLTLDEKDQWQSNMLFDTNVKPLINRNAKSAFVF